MKHGQCSWCLMPAILWILLQWSSDKKPMHNIIPWGRVGFSNVADRHRNAENARVA